jgi:superfamily II DNA/RNA helicase
LKVISYQIGDWVWLENQQQSGQVLDQQTVWGETIYRLWFPDQERVLRVSASELHPLRMAAPLSAAAIRYRAASARVADALTQDILIAPIESPVIPLPHQIRALSRVVAGNHTGQLRFLLADEVGLGKTIEAGLVLRELKLRGLARRILVVVPKGLVTQWVAEMRLHFNEDFRLILPGNHDHTSDPEQNLWRQQDQVVCPMDSVKPVEGRRGWSTERLAAYNRSRFDDLISASWDLIVVDEAHRLGGSSDQVARYQLGQGLADAAPYLLLLSATPHQGKSDAFRRLMSLLDSDAFPDESSIKRERVRPYVVRTEKREAINADGESLFQPRYTQLWTVAWDPARPAQRQLYEAVSDYVREGYNQAIREKKSYIGFLLILMQRLVTSSTRAVRTTLERRLEVLRQPEEQSELLTLFNLEAWAELDGESQSQMATESPLHALANEQAEVEHLLALAAQAEAAGPDAKAQALLDWVYRLQRETGEPELKVLIFTEFVPTQEMLAEFLAGRGFTVVTLNGSMDLDSRQKAQIAFAESARFLVSTDAGGEGLNMQFCHIVINYDIPWNPMRLEQRIGRVDRIGQTKPVRAINFILADTVEARVQEVLETKLKVILKQFGVDKTADVLDSAEGGALFDELYREAILHPEAIDESIEATLEKVREQAQANRQQTAVLHEQEPLDPAAARATMNHPLPRWIEQMTVAYMRAHGGTATQQGDLWDLTWPDGRRQPRVTFVHQINSQAQHITLAETAVRDLATNLPSFIEGQSIPCLNLNGLPTTVQGIWSLWQIGICSGTWQRQRLMPLFQNAERRVFLPAARRIWEQLLVEPIEVTNSLSGEMAVQAAKSAWTAMEQSGRTLYEEMVREQSRHHQREREKMSYAFAARRRAINRIGLLTVRQYRLSQLEQEEAVWQHELAQRVGIVPEVKMILILTIKGLGD